MPLGCKITEGEKITVGKRKPPTISRRRLSGELLGLACVPLLFQQRTDENPTNSSFQSRGQAAATSL